MLEDLESDYTLFEIAAESSHLDLALRQVTTGQGGMDFFSGRGVYRDRRAYPLPDVLVVDLRMPNVSGVEFIRWCRGNDECRNIPVVVLTGSLPGDPVINTALAAGANRVFLKPIHIHEWQKIVRQVRDLGLKHKQGNTSERVAKAA